MGMKRLSIRESLGKWVCDSSRGGLSAVLAAHHAAEGIAYLQVSCCRLLCWYEYGVKTNISYTKRFGFNETNCSTSPYETLLSVSGDTWAKGI